MRRGLLCFLTLATGLPAAVPAAPVPPPPPILTPGSWSPETAIRDGIARCGGCRTTTPRFLVGFERHHGFYLMPDGNLRALTQVVFANADVGDRFAQFLSPDNRQALYGKRVYCDCTGIHYEIVGGAIFRISRARLFAR